MANVTRNFIAGRMNKVVDQRLVPDGEYIDAMNVRMGSTEDSEIGVVENTKGNSSLTSLSYTDGTPLSTSARCIGAIQDSARETIYWFVHDPDFPEGDTGKLDLIVSYNVNTNTLVYHVISIDDGDGVYTTLNFNPSYLITGINIVDDLLFFTDDYNPPRFINLTRGYANPIANVDQFSAESILVIKKPPTESPAIQPIVTSGQENYLETRFICFAYRYKYADGEYSATSQWSAPAFVPNQFQFDISSMLNKGMTNYCNATIVSYNSGGPLVVGIDLLFKQAENNVIKIIQKIDKAESGLSDNQVYSITFNNSKIFTVLDEAEILRLYDNVPLLAKAQTIMGNRLMYGNYIEGYDLIDKNGYPTKIEFQSTLVTEEIGNLDLVDTTFTGVYNIDPTSIGLDITDSIVVIDLDGIDLVQGAAISLDVTITHSQWSGYIPSPDTVTDNTDLSITYLLTRDYSSAYDLATSDEFRNSIGTIGNILPVSTTVVGQETSCSGVTFTDSFNCALPNNLGVTPTSFIKYGSGINNILEPILIITQPSNTQIGFQFPSMVYVDNIAAPTQKAYEYFRVVFASASYQKIGNPGSLHSNRGYEVGIVYMDEFNRATTALVSPNNSIHIPCAYAENKNSIQITIPPTQVAPEFAKRYKFVIKPDAEKYETIYSNLFFLNPNANEAWLLLEGENMRKVEDGDTLIVKSDTQGPPQNCSYVTVLEKVSQPKGFLEIPSDEDPTIFYDVPAGLYIKISPNNINLIKSENALIAPGNKQRWASGGDSTILSYPMNIAGEDAGNPTWDFIDYTVPAGSRIEWYVDWNRAGRKQCEPRGYTLTKTYISSIDYPNMYEWFVGDNIALTINSGIDKGDGEINTFVPRLYYPLNSPITGTITSLATPNKLIDSAASFISDGVVAGVQVRLSYGGVTSTIYAVSVVSDTEIILSFNIPAVFPVGTPYEIRFYNPDVNFWQFYRNVSTNELSISFSSTNSCTGSNYKYSRRIYVTANIQVFRAEDTLIFETEPADALADVFYENELSFGIDEDGNHLGNLQNQNIAAGTPAIVDTNFFNCFSFGNGVESYKIEDSIVGRSFNFGQRVTTVADQDYKRANRFSDITYSGIYNGESNINRLNQFNSGLSNFKHCEASFGEIQLLDGRNTDVLVLQEDKISYVLAEKNLLSDASAGGIITATPAVLGTQIARTEKYGISFNPESYVQWGFDRYFTDVKRGAVIQLKGGDAQNEQLTVVSEQNMRTWFRDVFNNSFNTQKLGGFDPYMNEYVLVINERNLPVNPQCLDCGITQAFTLSIDQEEEKQFTYCVDLGPLVGFSNIEWVFTSIDAGATINFSANYNGVVVDSGYTAVDGSFGFDKDSVSVETVEITLSYTGDMVVSVTANCCDAEPLTIVEVVLTNDSESNKTIHTQYRYSIDTFVGPLASNLVLFQSGTSSPLVSRYNLISGFVGSGGFPPQTSIMRLSTNQISPDDFLFNPSQDKFRYLRTNTLYDNNDVDMQAMILASTIATPNSGTEPLYYADFTVPSSSLGEYLYLIWDLRDAVELELCYALTVIDACCDCTTDTYYLNANFTSATSIYTDNTLSTFAADGFYTEDGIVRELVDGILLPQQTCNPCAVEVDLCFGATLTDVTCDCDETCTTPYNTYNIVNPSLESVTVGFYNQDGIYQEDNQDPTSSRNWCSIGTPTCSEPTATITFYACGCV